MSTAAKVGFWSSLAAFAMAAGYSIVQILQMLGVLTFPWDEILIFGFSIGIPARVFSKSRRRCLSASIATVFRLVCADSRILLPARMNS